MPWCLQQRNTIIHRRQCNKILMYYYDAINDYNENWNTIVLLFIIIGCTDQYLSDVFCAVLRSKNARARARLCRLSSSKPQSATVICVYVYSIFERILIYILYMYIGTCAFIITYYKRIGGAKWLMCKPLLSGFLEN